MSFKQVRNPHMKNRVVTTDRAARWVVAGVDVNDCGGRFVLGRDGIGLHCLGYERAAQHSRPPLHVGRSYHPKHEDNTACGQR